MKDGDISSYERIAKHHNNEQLRLLAKALRGLQNKKLKKEEDIRGLTLEMIKLHTEAIKVIADLAKEKRLHEAN